MTIEAISWIIPFTGIIRHPELDDLEAKEKSEYSFDEKSIAIMEEERISVSPVYNSKGKITKEINKRYLDIFV
ncbi:MAG: hypothetical protein WAU65_01910 [Candidatus Nanoarchaeia archaeon]